MNEEVLSRQILDFIQVIISLIIHSHLIYLSLAVGRTCVTVCDFAHHESSKAQWLERSNRYSGGVMGSTPVGDLENLFPSI